jgi:predicted membrane protein
MNKMYIGFGLLAFLSLVIAIIFAFVFIWLLNDFSAKMSVSGVLGYFIFGWCARNVKPN